MTKITVSRIYEKAVTAGKQAAQELEPFIDWVNTLADNLIRITRNGIGITDNFDATTQTVTVQSGIPYTFSSRKPLGVFVLSQTPLQYPLRTFVWQADGNNITITPVFDGSPPATQNISLQLWIQFS